MAFHIFTFIFCLEPTVREQLHESELLHCYGNSFENAILKVLITAIFKVLSQQSRGTSTTSFERHLTVEDFTDMHQHPC